MVIPNILFNINYTKSNQKVQHLNSYILAVRQIVQFLSGTFQVLLKISIKSKFITDSVIPNIL